MSSDPTDRSVQRDDAAGLIAAGNTAVANPAQVWGSPEVEDDIKLWGNFGIDLANNKELYGHANYVTKTVTAASTSVTRTRVARYSAAMAVPHC